MQLNNMIKESDLKNLSVCIAESNHVQNLINIVHELNKFYLNTRQPNTIDFHIKNTVIHSVEIFSVK